MPLLAVQMEEKTSHECKTTAMEWNKSICWRVFCSCVSMCECHTNIRGAISTIPLVFVVVAWNAGIHTHCSRGTRSIQTRTIALRRRSLIISALAPSAMLHSRFEADRKHVWQQRIGLRQERIAWIQNEYSTFSVCLHSIHST